MTLLFYIALFGIVFTAAYIWLAPTQPVDLTHDDIADAGDSFLATLEIPRHGKGE